jgi:hypothetical protein
MKNKQDYLKQLETFLTPLTSEQRAQCIVRVSERIDDLQKHSPDQKISLLLASLGEPKALAMQFFNELNIPWKLPEKPVAKNSLFKKLLLTSITLFTLFAVGISLLVWKFTPIVEINEETGRVQFFGGLIDINEDLGQLNTRSKIVVQDQNNNHYSGKESIDTDLFQLVSIDFKQAKLIIKNSIDQTISYQCQSERLDQDVKIIQDTPEYYLQIPDVENIACKIYLPTDIKIKIRGNDSAIKFSFIENDLDFKATSGRVGFAPAPDVQYRYRLSNSNGTIDKFENSNRQSVKQINIELESGSIERL